MFVGLGSDYAQKKRPKEQARQRGKILKINPQGKITLFASCDVELWPKTGHYTMNQVPK